LGERRRRHRRDAEERRRDAVVHLLVDQHAEDAIAAQHLDRLARAGRTLGHDRVVFELPHLPDHAVDQGIVRRAVDLDVGQADLARGKREQLPIRQMAGEQDSRLVAAEDRGGVVDADRLDPAALTGVARDFVYVRVFGDDAAEIVPHAADDARPIRRGELRHRALKIALGAARDCGPRPDHAADESADRRCGIHRQQPERPEQQRGPGCFERIGDPARQTFSHEIVRGTRARRAR